MATPTRAIVQNVTISIFASVLILTSIGARLKTSDRVEVSVIVRPAEVEAGSMAIVEITPPTVKLEVSFPREQSRELRDLQIRAPFEITHILPAGLADELGDTYVTREVTLVLDRDVKSWSGVPWIKAKNITPITVKVRLALIKEAEFAIQTELSEREKTPDRGFEVAKDDDGEPRITARPNAVKLRGPAPVLAAFKEGGKGVVYTEAISVIGARSDVSRRLELLGFPKTLVPAEDRVMVTCEIRTARKPLSYDLPIRFLVPPGFDPAYIFEVRGSPLVEVTFTADAVFHGELQERLDKKNLYVTIEVTAGIRAPKNRRHQRGSPAPRAAAAGQL